MGGRRGAARKAVRSTKGSISSGPTLLKAVLRAVRMRHEEMRWYSVTFLIWGLGSSQSNGSSRSVPRFGPTCHFDSYEECRALYLFLDISLQIHLTVRLYSILIQYHRHSRTSLDLANLLCTWS